MGIPLKKSKATQSPGPAAYAHGAIDHALDVR